MASSAETCLQPPLPRASASSRAFLLLIAAIHLLPWDCRAAVHSDSALGSALPARHGFRGRGLADADSNRVPPSSADRASLAAIYGTRDALLTDQLRRQASITGLPTNRVNGKCALARLKFGAIFTFGDSLSDVGNNNYGRLVSFYRANFPPYGMNFIPASGRFSDGKLVIDYLSEYFELPAAPAAFQPGINSSAAQNGLNFASSGAGVLDTSTPDKGFPLSVQLSRFSELGGLQAADQSDSPPLAIVSMGTNDYIAFLEKGINMGRQLDPSELQRLAELLPQSQSLITAVVRGITDAVRTLYASGFRHFLLFDTLPIGCTPIGLATIAEARGQLLNEPAPLYCTPAVNLITGEHSSVLALALDGLRDQLNDATVVYARMHGLMQAMTERPRDYGLNVGTSACCGAPRPINGLVQCGTSIFISNGTQSSTPATLCDDSQSRTFWDLVHPSQAANQVVARALVRALQAGICDVDMFRFASNDNCGN
ncbi:unnamed protein product [Closterium sp. NIES-65]|nr:unnamed protein product [Closterium sp. NIES-65]